MPRAELLGVFGVSVLHNAVRILFGLGMVALGVLLGTRMEDRSIDRAP